MTSKPFRRPFRLEAEVGVGWRCQSTFATREAAVSWLRARPTRIIDTRTGQDVTTESEPIADPEARVLAAEVAARGYVCRECDQPERGGSRRVAPYPCPTVTAITEALEER